MNAHYAAAIAANSRTAGAEHDAPIIGTDAGGATAHNAGALCSSARSDVEFALGRERGEHRFGG
jgi:hypothetical protein